MKILLVGENKGKKKIQDYIYVKSYMEFIKERKS